jgi:hypothetical protein
MSSDVEGGLLPLIHRLNRFADLRLDEAGPNNLLDAIKRLEAGKFMLVVNSISMS